MYYIYRVDTVEIVDNHPIDSSQRKRVIGSIASSAISLSLHPLLVSSLDSAGE